MLPRRVSPALAWDFVLPCCRHMTSAQWRTRGFAEQILTFLHVLTSALGSLITSIPLLLLIPQLDHSPKSLKLGLYEGNLRRECWVTK